MEQILFGDLKQLSCFQGATVGLMLLRCGRRCRGRPPVWRNMRQLQEGSKGQWPRSSREDSEGGRIIEIKSKYVEFKANN